MEGIISFRIVQLFRSQVKCEVEIHTSGSTGPQEKLRKEIGGLEKPLTVYEQQRDCIES